jgi:hypothetical protein
MKKPDPDTKGARSLVALMNGKGKPKTQDEFTVTGLVDKLAYCFKRTIMVEVKRMQRARGENVSDSDDFSILDESSSSEASDSNEEEEM